MSLNCIAWCGPLQAFSPNEACGVPGDCPDIGLYNFTALCKVPAGGADVVPAVVARQPDSDDDNAGECWWRFHAVVVPPSDLGKHDAILGLAAGQHVGGRPRVVAILSAPPLSCCMLGAAWD